MRRFALPLLAILLLGSQSAMPMADQNAMGQTVYITRTGTKYHKSSCQHLRQSKIAIQLAEAKRKGYGPCKTCKP